MTPATSRWITSNNDGVCRNFAGNPGTAGTLSTNSIQFSDPKQSCSPSCRIMQGHDFHCIPTKWCSMHCPKNQHHLISQFDNRFGVTSLGTTGQIWKLQNWHHHSAHYVGIDQVTKKTKWRTSDVLTYINTWIIIRPHKDILPVWSLDMVQNTQSIRMYNKD